MNITQWAHPYLSMCGDGAVLSMHECLHVFTADILKNILYIYIYIRVCNGRSKLRKLNENSFFLNFSFDPRKIWFWLSFKGLPFRIITPLPWWCYCDSISPFPSSSPSMRVRKYTKLDFFSCYLAPTQYYYFQNRSFFFYFRSTAGQTSSIWIKCSKKGSNMCLVEPFTFSTLEHFLLLEKIMASFVFPQCPLDRTCVWWIEAVKFIDGAAINRETETSLSLAYYNNLEWHNDTVRNLPQTH